MRPDMKTYDPIKHAGMRWKYAHIKRDGHYLKVQKSVGGQLYCWTSNPTDITKQLTFCTWFPRARDLPLGVSLLGELWLPGSRSEAIKTSIKECDQHLRFDVFAIDAYVPNAAVHSRLQAMELREVSNICKVLGFEFINWIESPFDPSRLHINIRGIPNIEGFVLKNGNLQDWYKLKPRRTIDLVVTGLVVGTGKYRNQLGSLNCETTEGYEVANVSGMTDQQRQAFSDGSIIGKVIEVEYQNVGANGRLRHPSFVRVRDDKEVNQCSVSQDDALCLYWDKPLLK